MYVCVCVCVCVCARARARLCLCVCISNFLGKRKYKSLGFFPEGNLWVESPKNNIFTTLMIALIKQNKENENCPMLEAGFTATVLWNEPQGQLYKV